MRTLLKSKDVYIKARGLLFQWEEDCEMFAMISEKTARILAYVDDDELAEIIEAISE